jgi:hypothetical protein
MSHSCGLRDATTVAVTHNEKGLVPRKRISGGNRMVRESIQAETLSLRPGARALTEPGHVDCCNVGNIRQLRSNALPVQQGSRVSVEKEASRSSPDGIGTHQCANLGSCFEPQPDRVGMEDHQLDSSTSSTARAAPGRPRYRRGAVGSIGDRPVIHR